MPCSLLQTEEKSNSFLTRRNCCCLIVLAVVAIFCTLIYTLHEKQEGDDPSQAEIVSDHSEDAAKLIVSGDSTDKDKSKDVMEAIKTATKGDGTIRPVLKNDQPVDDTIVKLAAFENQDFVLRDEKPQKEQPYSYDPTLAQPRSHFRPMTHPLVWEKGALAMG